jgi:hypothetical protein
MEEDLEVVNKGGCRWRKTEYAVTTNAQRKK